MWPGLPALLSSQDLRQIRRVLFAVGTDKTRPLLMGVNLDGRFASATDSMRIARAGLSTEVSTANVPADFTRQVLRHLVGDAKLRSNDGRVEFESNTGLWATRQLAGEYPNLSRHLAVPGYRTMRFATQELSAALNLLAVFDEAPVHVEPTGKTARLRVVDSQSGESMQKVSCESDRVDPLCFNLAFLLDACEAHRDEALEFEIQPGAKLVTIRTRDFEQVLAVRTTP